MISHNAKADDFRDLHVKGEPLVLFNIWDAGSAAAAAKAGVPAVATSSWAVAAAAGYEDGERLPIDEALSAIGRIVRSTDLPVTADFEGGYAEDPAGIVGHVARLIETGVSGLNFEDQRVGSEGLYDIERQAGRLGAVRETGAASGARVFLNARTDVFLKARPDDDREQLLAVAIERAAAYEEAGADGFFVPGLTDLAAIKTLCSEVRLPVNVMWRADPSDFASLAQCGVARISLGPAPFFAAMDFITQSAKACISPSLARRAEPVAA